MRTELFWVPMALDGRLAVAPRPRGGDWLADEMAAWRKAGIDVVVSLLTPEEVIEFELEREAEEARAAGIRFRAFPIPDRDVPVARSEFRELVTGVARELAAGRRVVVHCRQGIGRAGLLAASVAIATGVAPAEAATVLTAARGRPVPETPAQRRWLDDFAHETLTTTGSSGKDKG
jgi:protein-tyrosine phosphatase